MHDYILVTMNAECHAIGRTDAYNGLRSAIRHSQTCLALLA